MRIPAEGIINREIAICGNTVYPGYIIQGTRATMMIEAGLTVLGPTYYQGIKKFLGERSLDYLLVTHGHYDHLGAITYLKKKMPDLKLMGYGTIEPLLQKENVLKTMNFLSKQTGLYFEDIMSHLSANEDIAIAPVEFARDLKEGDTVDLGNIHCEVYETPGHTKDHLSFFFPDEGILFPGEAFGNAILPKENEVKVEFVSSYTDYIKSMEKLIKLIPQVKILALSHLFYYTGDDVSRFVEMAMRDTLHYKKMIEEYLDGANGDAARAIDEMVRVEYDIKKAVYQERNAYITNLQAQFKAVAALRA